MDGVRKYSFSLLTGLVFSVLFLGLSGSQYASAGGPPCSDLSVTDGDAFMEWTCEDLTVFSFYGIDHNDETEVHLCGDFFNIGETFGNPSVCSDTDLDGDIHNWALAYVSGSADETANTITLNYESFQGAGEPFVPFLTVKIVMTLEQVSATVAEVTHEHTITICPDDTEDCHVDIKYIHSTDADVDTTPDGSDNLGDDNFVEYDASSQKLTISEGGILYEVEVDTTASTTPLDWVGICDVDTEGGDECELDSQPTAGHLTLLPGVDVPLTGPGDWDTGLEFDFDLNHVVGGSGPLSHTIVITERIVLPGEEMAPPRPTLPGAEMFMFSSNTAEVNAGHITYQQGISQDPIEDVCNNVGEDWPSQGPAFIVSIYDGTLTPSGTPAGVPWKEHLDIDPTAEYVSNAADGNELADDFTSTGRTALYSHTFEFTPEIFPLEGQASLLFDYLSDNDLGIAGEDVGLLLNCVPIPLSSMTSPESPAGGGNNEEFFTQDQFEGPFDVTSLLNFGPNTLQIYLVNYNGPSGIQYKASFGFDQCVPGFEPAPIEPNGVQISEEEQEFECVPSAKPNGGGDHEPATIGILRDGQYVGGNCDIGIDGQCFKVTKPYHHELELLQMLTSPHTISNEIYCNEGYQECNHITIGFLEMDKYFPNTVMSVTAEKAVDGTWSVSWSDPQDFIRDPADPPEDNGEITFTSQIIDNKRVGTSFSLDFRNKDTGQLKIGFHVEDIENGFTNIYANEGIMLLDADAYPAVEASYEDPLKIDSLCLGEDPDYRNSCAFSQKREWVTQNAEETLRQMQENTYKYE